MKTLPLVSFLILADQHRAQETHPDAMEAANQDSKRDSCDSSAVEGKSQADRQEIPNTQYWWLALHREV